MGKKRLPPASHDHGDLYGPTIKEFSVVSWSKDQQSPATAVAVVATAEDKNGTWDLVLKLKTPAKVDEVIQMLLRHKRHVWPDAP